MVIIIQVKDVMNKNLKLILIILYCFSQTKTLLKISLINYQKKNEVSCIIIIKYQLNLHIKLISFIYECFLEFIIYFTIFMKDNLLMLINEK